MKEDIELPPAVIEYKGIRYVISDGSAPLNAPKPKKKKRPKPKPNALITMTEIYLAMAFIGVAAVWIIYRAFIPL
jgi:hypothetical protein